MSHDRRNPYVILGLDYGAHADEAAVGWSDGPVPAGMVGDMGGKAFVEPSWKRLAD